MSLIIHPQQRDGLMRWERNALVLHFLWGWEFIVTCCMELFNMFMMVAPFQTQHDREMRFYYLFFILTLILLITILAEICLFANSHLEANKWLVLQVLKLVYVATAFGIFVGCGGSVGGKGTCSPLVFDWGNARAVRVNLAILGVFWTPWTAGVVCGVLARLQGGRKPKEDLVGEEEVRRPLLPRRISPGERRAVYR